MSLTFFGVILSSDLRDYKKEIINQDIYICYEQLKKSIKARNNPVIQEPLTEELLEFLVKNKSYLIGLFDQEKYRQAFVNQDYITVLHLAAFFNCSTIISKQAQEGANIKVCTNENWAPIHFAVMGNSLKSLKILHEHGADLEARTSQDSKPIHIAVNYNAVDALLALLESNVEVDAGYTDDHYTALHGAAQKNLPDMLFILLKYKADINSRNLYGLTPLHMALIFDSDNAAKMLIRRKANINAKTFYNLTALHYAVAKNNYELTRLLLCKGAEIQARDNYLEQAIHYAAYYNADKAFMALMHYEAPLNTLTEGGYTPVHIAIRENSCKLLRLLLEYGASVQSHIEGSLFTPLHTASNADNSYIIDLLIVYGADIEAQAENNITPLLAAAQNNSTQAARCLIKHRANVNAISSNRSATPLHYACKKGSLALVEYLLAANAQKNSKDSRNKTAQDWIIKKSKKLSDYDDKNELFALIVQRLAHNSTSIVHDILNYAQNGNFNYSYEIFNNYLFKMPVRLHSAYYLENIYSKDHNENNPLHLAAGLDSELYLKALIAVYKNCAYRAAPLLSTNKRGQTPLDIVSYKLKNCTNIILKDNLKNHYNMLVAYKKLGEFNQNLLNNKYYSDCYFITEK